VSQSRCYGLDYQAARGPRAGEVLVFPDAVVVLGTWHALAGDRRLIAVALTADALELTVEWETRGGPASDTARVPVPEGARETAEEAAEHPRGRIAS
jgi:hypothetical protein